VFTQRHYIAIAKVLRETMTVSDDKLSITDFGLAHDIVHNLTDMFEKDNEKFNVQQFLDAIYGKEVTNENK